MRFTDSDVMSPSGPAGQGLCQGIRVLCVDLPEGAIIGRIDNPSGLEGQDALNVQFHPYRQIARHSLGPGAPFADLEYFLVPVAAGRV